MPQTNPGMAGGERDTQQQANELETAAAPAKEQAEQEFVDLTPNSPPEGVAFEGRGGGDLIPSYDNEDDEFLFGATDLPEQSGATGVLTQRSQPPKNAFKYLSALVKAAEDPDAPAELHAFIRILQESLSASD